MLDPVRAKLRILGLTAITFFGGVLFASGMEWTTGSYAAALLQQAPNRAETRPVAELSDAFVAISDAVTPAVVSIETERIERMSTRQRAIPERFRDLFGLPPEGEAEEGEMQEIPMPGAGSGFIISRDGYVMTNNHVVQGAERIRVILHDRSVHDARIVGRDPTTDVAVIKMEGSSYPTVRFGNPAETKVGQWVLAIGNPLGLDFTVTAGIVSAKGRPLQILQRTLEEELAGYAVESFIQTDAAINPGNSGGPLVNINGEVIGINSAIASQSGFSEGYGFAVPIDLARRIADDLIRYGAVRRPVLGVSIAEVDPEDAEYFRLPEVAGVKVNDFSMPNSPAERAGIRPGDVIVGVDGEPVSQVNELQSRILTHHPGERVSLDLIRQGERRRVEVQLVEADNPALSVRQEEARPRATVSGAGRLGISVEPLTPELVQEYGITAGPREGIVITEVEPYSAAGRRLGRGSGARIVEVDGKPVQTPQEFGRALEGKRPGEVVGLTLLNRTGVRQIVTIRVPAAASNTNR